MSETGCLKDGNFQNLQIENTTILDMGNVTLTGKLTIGSTSTHDVNWVSPIGLSPVMITHSTASRAVANGGSYPSIMGTVNSVNIVGYDMPACEALFSYLSNLDSLSVVQSTHLFGTAASASQTSTITEAAASALDNADGYATTLTPQFLTGDWSAAKDIGATNPFADLGDNIQQLIVFGGNTSTGTGALTFSLTGSDKFDDSGSSIAVTGAGTQVFTFITPAGGDDSIDITLTPQATTNILKGSFIYLEHTGADAVNVRGYIKVSGGTLTAAIPG
jgi:hypothetical protein